MRASWSALHASFTRVLNRTSSETDFKAIRLAHAEIGAFLTIPALMEHQCSGTGDPTARFQVIRALVAASQSDATYRSTAQMMVIMALWPGLDAVFWRLARGFPTARDDLATEILSRLGEAILTLDLERVMAVTATLLRNLERDIRRDLINARVLANTNLPIDDPTITTAVSDARAPGVGPRAALADCLACLNQKDAVLLKRVFLLGETQEAAGVACGLRPDAARKRIQRAMKKLQSHQKTLPPLSHSVQPTGL